MESDIAAMREIVFDTETTGLNPATGDRLVEIGCIELINRVETGRSYHCYYNPQRAMPYEAEQVHGLSDRFLSDKPLFADRAEELLDFLADSPLFHRITRWPFVPGCTSTECRPPVGKMPGIGPAPTAKRAMSSRPSHHSGME